MADTQPLYTWRDPKANQQPNSMFGALGGGNSYFGGQLNTNVNQAGGFPSPVAPKANDGAAGGFNVPGGSSAGFNSAAFNAGAPPAPAPGAQQPASFGDALRQNPLAQPLIRSASENIMQGLQPNAQPSMSSMFALNEYNKSEGEALRQSKEASALNGRAMTGQIQGDTQDYMTQKLLPARQNFLGQLQGQEQQQQITKQQNAFGNLATLAGMGQQGEQFAQSQAQTKELTLADLSQREQTIANQASQFQDQLSFNKYATDKGFTEQEAARAWQAQQNTQQQTFQAGQNELSRALTKYTTDQGIQLDTAKLAETVRQFNSNQDFQKWATQAGLDQKTAQNIWQAQQNDIQRKFESGQQLSAQENNVLLEGMKEKNDAGMAALQHTLNLDTLDKQNAHDVLLKNMDNAQQVLMSDKGFSQEEALAQTKQDYAVALEKMGYDHATAMQASDQYFQSQQQQKQLDQAKMLSEATLAQQSSMFAQDLQQKYNFKAADIDLAKQTLSQEQTRWFAEFGLKKEQVDSLVASDSFKTLSDSTSTLMAMAGDNPDMLRFAAENFYKGMGNMKDAAGNPLMSPEQQTAGLLSIKASSFSDPAKFTAWATDQKDASGNPLYTADQIATASGDTGADKGKKDTLVSQIGDIGGDPASLAKWKDARGSDAVNLGDGVIGNVSGFFIDKNGKQHGDMIQIKSGGKTILYLPGQNRFDYYDGRDHMFATAKEALAAAK